MGGHGRALWQEGRRAFVGMGNHGRVGAQEGMGRAAYYKMQESPYQGSYLCPSPGSVPGPYQYPGPYSCTGRVAKH